MPPKFCIIPFRALQEPSLTGSDIRVLAAIGKHTDPSGAGCFARSTTLAREAGVSHNQFWTSTKRLLAARLITRNSGQATGSSSLYSIIFDEPTPTTVVPPRNEVPQETVVHPPQNLARPHPDDRGGISDPSSAPNNVPIRRRDFRTQGEQLFAEILRSKQTARGTHATSSFFPKAVIDALPEPAKRAWEDIGGNTAVIGADDAGIRVLQGRFGRHYETHMQAPLPRAGRRSWEVDG
jgi:hypothetical protein